MGEGRGTGGPSDRQFTGIAGEQCNARSRRRSVFMTNHRPTPLAQVSRPRRRIRLPGRRDGRRPRGGRGGAGQLCGRHAAVSDDRTLIRYLMRHWHTTPFEMAEVKLLVRVPMDCWRQWIRHRMASINETSTRYSDRHRLRADHAGRPVAAAGRRQSPGERRLSGSRGGRRAFGRGGGVAEARPAGVRASAGRGRRPRAGPQRPAAFDLHRGLLEGRSAQSAALPALADGPARAVGDSPVRRRRSARRSSARCFRWCGRRLRTTGWRRYN